LKAGGLGRSISPAPYLTVHKLLVDEISMLLL
jgi:hypothetical protein